MGYLLTHDGARCEVGFAGDRGETGRMGTLIALIDGLASGAIDVIDLTAPLSADTPIIQLPPEFGQTGRFALEEISRYDERGPAWYWNNFRSGEHTGTHFDAPKHWVTGKDSTMWLRCLPVG